LLELIGPNANGNQGGADPSGLVMATVFGFMRGDNAPVFDDKVRNGLHGGSPKCEYK
jgi:hypothetical protein